MSALSVYDYVAEDTATVAVWIKHINVYFSQKIRNVDAQDQTVSWFLPSGRAENPGYTQLTLNSAGAHCVPAWGREKEPASVF